MYSVYIEHQKIQSFFFHFEKLSACMFCAQVPEVYNVSNVIHNSLSEHVPWIEMSRKVGSFPRKGQHQPLTPPRQQRSVRATFVESTEIQSLTQRDELAPLGPVFFSISTLRFHRILITKQLITTVTTCILKKLLFFFSWQCFFVCFCLHFSPFQSRAVCLLIVCFLCFFTTNHNYFSIRPSRGTHCRFTIQLYMIFTSGKSGLGRWFSDSTFVLFDTKQRTNSIQWHNLFTIRGCSPLVCLFI